MSLRIVLMGTGEFALPPFRALVESDDCTVVGVYTQPDRKGRGHHRHVNKVKQLAEDNEIPVFQPPKVNAPEALDELRALEADVFIVAAYGQIMKPEFLAIPRLGALNLHGSLLPRHRGAAPVQYSIWKGDDRTGVTMFRIEPALDSGPIVGVVSTDILPDETSGELMLRLADLSVNLTLDVVQQLSAGTAVFVPQDDSAVTLAPKIGKEEGLIDWSQAASEIACQVRALQPWPKASTWLHVEDRPPMRCILLATQPVVQNSLAPATPGQIRIEENRAFVGTGSGLLEVLTIQPQGKKSMDAKAFVNGYGVSQGAVFSSTES